MIKYSYESFLGDIREIARQCMKADFRPDVIAGISRGGLVPATYLAQYFEVPVITVYGSLRDQNEKPDTEPLILRTKPGDVILMIDDIIDNGDTMRKITESYASKTSDQWAEKHLKTAALWLNPAQNFEPDFHAREINRLEDDRWIIFPWEDYWR